MMKRKLLGNMLRQSYFAIALMFAAISTSSAAFAGDMEEYAFSIPSMTVDSAINAVAQQANKPAIFPFDKVRMLNAKPIYGTFSLEDALSQILKGTDFKAYITESGVITVLTRDSNQKTTDAEISAPAQNIDQIREDQMLSKGKKALLGGVSTALLTALTPNGVANAQEAAFDEIVVTAQKRTQSVQDVPITISALDPEAISERGIVDIKDIVGQLPNISTGAPNPLTTNFTIRGIGTNNFQGNVNRSVGVYIDDVTQSHAFTGVLGVFDTERVEVLRGPQNTLNGRNTTGGAINFISVKPQIGAGTNGYGSVTYGRFDQINLEGAVGFDLGATAAVRIGGQVQLRDGPFTNIAPGREGEELGETEKYSGRAQLLWAPTNSTEVLSQFRFGFNRGTLNGSLSNGFLDPNQDLSSAAGFNGFPGTVPPPPGTLPNTTQPPGFDDNSLALCPDILQSGVFAGQGGPLTNCVDIFGSTGSTNFREISNSSSALADTDVLGGTIRIDHDLGFASLTSITAYDYVDVNLVDDSLGTAGLQFQPQQDSEHKAFQQELRLVSSDEEALRWIVGGYFFTEKLEQGVNVRQDQNPLNATPPPTFGNQFTAFSFLDQTDRDLSAFVQADYDLTDKLTVSGGVRFTNNRKTADSIFGIVLTPLIGATFPGGPNGGLTVPSFAVTDFISNEVIFELLGDAQAAGVLQAQAAGGPPPFIANNFSDGDVFGVAPDGGPVRQNINRLTGDFSLNYELNEQANIFFRYARGFKSGAFDTRALAALAGSGANLPVGPETINAYEIGLKSNPAPNIQFNASAFYYDQEDLQVFSAGPLGPQFLNVPSSEVLGIEVDALWAPTDTTKISVAGGWVDSEIKDSGGLSGVDDGHSLRNTPEFSATVTASQDFYLGDARLNIFGSFRYIDDQLDSLNFAEDPLSRKPEQTYIDLNVSYNFGQDERYSVSAFGRNLTGEAFCAELASLTQPLQTAAAAGLDPTTSSIRADSALGQVTSCDPGNEGTPLWGVSFRGEF